MIWYTFTQYSGIPACIGPGWACWCPLQATPHFGRARSVGRRPGSKGSLGPGPALCGRVLAMLGSVSGRLCWSRIGCVDLGSDVSVSGRLCRSQVGCADLRSAVLISGRLRWSRVGCAGLGSAVLVSGRMCWCRVRCCGRTRVEHGPPCRNRGVGLQVGPCVPCVGGAGGCVGRGDAGPPQMQGGGGGAAPPHHLTSIGRGRVIFITCLYT